LRALAKVHLFKVLMKSDADFVSKNVAFLERRSVRSCHALTHQDIDRVCTLGVPVRIKRI